MIGARVLNIDGSVDAIRRLHRDPPVEWSGDTAWSCHDGPTGKALVESAVIECPECSSRAYWRDGMLRCDGCQKQRLVG